MIFDKYPYTNFHEMNDDWLIQTLREFGKRLDDFVAANSLTYADPIEYDPATTYPAYTVLIYNDTAYMSKVTAPAGVAPTNDEYYLKIFPFGDLISQMVDEGVTAGVAVLTERVDQYLASAGEEIDAAIANIPLEVSDWMDDHPEITTPIPTASVSYPKLTTQLQNVLQYGRIAGTPTPIPNTDFSQGTINQSTGTSMSANNVCRTDFYSFDDGILTVRTLSGYSVTLFRYLSDGTYFGVVIPAIGSAFDAVTVHKNNKYRFTIMKSDQSNFTPADLPDNPITYREFLPDREYAIKSDIASEYSSASTYKVNDYVFYSGALYRCVTAITTAEAWTAEHWKTVALADDVSELQNAINNVTFPLELVATYENKILRKTGMADHNDYTVYQYKIPDNCKKVHIKSNFYGTAYIIFTDMSENGNFSSAPYQSYPSAGYPTPTTVDADYDTKDFGYVWIPLYKASGVETSATASLIDIVDFIGNNAIISNNTTGGLTDLNNAERNRVYVISSGIANMQNYPPIQNGGTLLCFAAYNIDNVQIFVSNQSALYMRRKWGTSWGNWTLVPSLSDVQPLIDAAFDAYYPINVLAAFKNITCIGDSLTFSQVYTSASTSRQAYKPYPKVLADKAGATAAILATAGDTAAQAWDRNNANIVQKDAQLTIIYLGTNGGLTDTISTDMVGGDYTQWANTNTGSYGKLIAKSLAVGSRVVLIKIHSSSGDVATTNSVIEQMATRFNVPVINNTYLSGTKYHSYPDGSGSNGTHYNDFGYAVFADQLANSISQLSPEDAVKIIPV